jgi:hypothetical protein
MNDSKISQENQGNPTLCPELRTTDLLPPFDTVSMKPKKAAAKVKMETLWTKSPVANLVRYEPSGIYFVGAKVRGKLIRKSLDTNVLCVTKQRLADVLDAEHRSVAPRSTKIVGKMTFAAGLVVFQQRQEQNPELKPRSIEYNERTAERLLKTRLSLAETDMKKITNEECINYVCHFVSGVLRWNGVTKSNPPINTRHDAAY